MAASDHLSAEQLAMFMPAHEMMMRKNWGKIQKDPGSKYKMDQIRRSM